MKKRIFSVILSLCLFLSSSSAVYAWQEESVPEGNAFTEESQIRLAADGVEIPTPTQVYQSMIALKDQNEYKEGTPWTDYEPYSDTKGYYHWKGGPLGGTKISAVGCVAFAFILSDTAFGSLPARMYTPNEFTFDQIRPGDILRMNNDTHTVIVLEFNPEGVVVAEGNNNGKVHWGRAISKAEVEGNISHYITRYPLDYVSPDDPEADKIIGEGSLGQLSWKLTKAGELTISGNGAMPDFNSAEEHPWKENSSKIRKVVIEPGVTNIGDGVFLNSSVLSVEIPTSVTAIGNNAFNGSSIISVTIPSNVNTIGDSAFRKCANLSSVTVSDGVKAIEQNAFRACNSLKTIALPASIEKVGAAAFFECEDLISATFAPSDKQVALGDNLFSECFYLMSVTLPKYANQMGAGMFMNCRRLSGVEIPKGVEIIGENTFASCLGFTTVIIPDSVTDIGRSAFQGTALKNIYFAGTEAQWNSISISPDMKNIISNAVKHYNYTTDIATAKVTLEKSEYNYDGTEKTPAVTVELNDKKLVLNTDYTVSYKDNIRPGTATVTVTGKAWYRGSQTKTFTITENGNGGSEEGDNTGGNSSGSGGNNNAGGNGSGSGSGSNTGGNDNSSGSDDSDKDDGQGIKPTPFAKGKTFTVSKITYKVTKVGKEVELKSAKSTAKKITVNTVKGTDGVTYKVTSIGSKAMQNNKKLTNLVIGTNVKKIGTSAFSGCTKLATITFGRNVTTIGTGAFRGCISLRKTLTLPDSVKTIGAGAFSGCNKITAVTIGKTSKSKLTTIGKSTFSGCKKLAKVTVRSKKVNSVGKQAFKNTKSSLKVKVPSKQLKKYKKIFKKAGLKEKQVTK